MWSLQYQTGAAWVLAVADATVTSNRWLCDLWTYCVTVPSFCCLIWNVVMIMVKSSGPGLHFCPPFSSNPFLPSPPVCDGSSSLWLEAPQAFVKLCCPRSTQIEADSHQQLLLLPRLFCDNGLYSHLVSLSKPPSPLKVPLVTARRSVIYVPASQSAVC